MRCAPCSRWCSLAPCSQPRCQQRLGDAEQLGGQRRTAGNANATFQGVEQAQAGGNGGGGAQRQYAALSNHTSQSAHAGVYNGQWNIYAPVYVNSPGAGSGNVSQSNSATNIAAAGNANGTDQAATQGQAAAGSGGGQDQAALVANGTSQSAHAGVYNGQ